MGGFAEHADLFLGRDPRDMERHHAVLDNLCFHYGRWWPLDLALWDLRGKIEGEPVYRLLGGTDNRVRTYASTALRRDEAASRDTAQGLVARGFGAIKLRFSTEDWRRDIARAAAVRDAVGPGIDLMVDLQPGLAHVLGHRAAVGPRDRPHRGLRARRARRLLDGRAAAPGRLRRHGGAARRNGRPDRRRRSDPRSPRVPHPDRARLPRRSATGLRLRRRHHGLRAHRRGGRTRPA